MRRPRLFRPLPSAPFAGLLLLLAFAATASAQEVIVDNSDGGFSVLSGSWTTGTASADKYGSDYRYSGTTSGDPTAEVEWRPTLPSDGIYEVAVWYPEGGNRAVNAPFTVTHADGTTSQTINQQTNGGGWLPLGLYNFVAGSTGHVRMANNASASVVLADAVRFRAVTFGTDEFRGIWVSRFEWPNSNADTMKTNIRTVMTDAVRGGFNAVVLQVRGQADTLYPSPDEPWSPLIGGVDPGFDPLRYALDEAHARGLQLHAYFNTHVVWSSNSAPSNGSHLYYQHCNPSDPNARDWLVVDDTGAVQSSTDDGYFWLAPGHPDVQAYLRKQIMHLVRTYPDLDGIHFDRIRMPGTEYSYDDTSEARRADRGNPDALGFKDWTRDQITRFLRDTCAEVRRESSRIQLSAAPLGLYRQSSYTAYGYPSGYLYGYTFTYQDAQAWMKAGALDWIAPQIYWADNGSNPEFSEILPDWLANDGGRHVYAGSDADASVTRTENEITAMRNLGGPGIQVWSYGTAAANDHFSALAASRFSEYAKQPDQPWRTAPSTGIVVGTITDFDTGEPVTDAWVTVNGEAYTALSSGDGLWSWLNLAPGRYTFTIEHPDHGTEQVTVDVAAGSVQTVDVAFGAPDPPAADGAGGCRAGIPSPLWPLQLLVLLMVTLTRALQTRRTTRPERR